MPDHKLIGCALFGVGTVLLLAVLVLAGGDSENTTLLVALVAMGSLLAVVGALAFLNVLPEKFKTGGGEVTFTRVESLELTSITQVEKVELVPEDKARKEAYASRLRLPTHGAPPFRVLTEKSVTELGLWPGADSSVPMYSLSADYRIIDWNKALNLAFDRSMEGLRGQLITEWVYHLDNYEEVLRRGQDVFSDANNLPSVDVEEVRFKSMRYKEFSATKRAYQVPGDDGGCAGWLVVLNLQMGGDEAHIQYLGDLIRIQRMDLLWSDYSIVYDKVLTNTKLYGDLIRVMIEGENGERPIPSHTKILDLGAGTGNLSEILSEPDKERLIVALDDNRMMLNVLQWKCKDRLTDDMTLPGVAAMKQDVTSLYGLDDEFFDYCVANNTLYALGNDGAILSCLKEVHRVLKPSGEIRLSGPKSDTDINKLFDLFKKDLKSSGKFDDLQNEFKHVEDINKNRLSRFLYNYDLNGMTDLVMKAGFKNISFKTDRAYGGEGMVIFATK